MGDYRVNNFVKCIRTAKQVMKDSNDQTYQKTNSLNEEYKS